MTRSLEQKMMYTCRFQNFLAMVLFYLLWYCLEI
jgi:hypothetical protein